MEKLLAKLKQDRRKAAEDLARDPENQDLQFTLADLHTSILAIEAVRAETILNESPMIEAPDLAAL